MKKNTNIRKSVFAIVCALMSAVAAVAASAAADVNGDGRENNKDVIALFRYVSGGDKAEDETAYDFNGDGSVNNKDVVSLFKYLSGETPKENELELFVKRADLSSYTLEETFYENGILDNRQVCEHKEGYDHLLITLNAEDEADGEYSFRQEFYTVLNEREGISDLIYERTHQHKWYGKSFDWPTYLMLARLNTKEFNLIIDPSLYDRVSDNVFIAKKGCEDDAGQDFFFDNGVIDWESSDIDYYPEEFVSIKITISGSDLTVYAESVVDCAGSVTERTYEVLLCKTGVTSFDVPEYETEPKGGLPGDNSYATAYVRSGGSVSSEGRNVKSDDITVRPALWINLGS